MRKQGRRDVRRTTLARERVHLGRTEHVGWLKGYAAPGSTYTHTDSWIGEYWCKSDEVVDNCVQVHYGGRV
jgi:hypothetical protein